MSLLRFDPIPIPESGDQPLPAWLPHREPAAEMRADEIAPAGGMEWRRLRFPVAIILALLAQIGLEARSGPPAFSLVVYLIAGIMIVWALLDGDLSPETLPMTPRMAGVLTFRPAYILAAAAFSAAAYLSAGENRFTFIGLIAWIAALSCLLVGLWEGRPPWSGLAGRLRRIIDDRQLTLRLTGWHVLLAGTVALALFMRLHQLDVVPREMVSDHAEKLHDVADILNGERSIFFTRNTGREALQFYLAAMTASLLGTGLTFLTLKIGTALVGILTLPYIYLFGEEVGGRKAGLAALALAGIGYWPNVISRIGLRFPFYALFAAPAMYYLARGLRTRKRNDFLLCGLAIGLGLQGYSPARTIPLVIIAGLLLYLLHAQASGQRWAIISWMLAAASVAMVTALPLIRVAVEMPEDVLGRMMSRVGSPEQLLTWPAVRVALDNLWDGLGMFTWDNGVIWVNSIPSRPALDWISGALLHLGVLITLVRYLRHRRWLDLFLLLSIPILILPSTLALAFPGENPAPNRAAGAIVPVFVLAAIPLAQLPDWFDSHWKLPHRRIFGWLSAVALTVMASNLNYDLVFNVYAEQYNRGAWNTSEAGEIIRGYAQSVGGYDTVHVVAYPHWMDTRLVAINAGQPGADYAVHGEELPLLAADPRAHLFLIHLDDLLSQDQVRSLFPAGRFSRVQSATPGRDFLLYVVPGDPATQVDPLPGSAE
jgi:hypothetical protein